MLASRRIVTLHLLIGLVFVLFLNDGVTSKRHSRLIKRITSAEKSQLNNNSLLQAQIQKSSEEEKKNLQDKKEKEEEERKAKLAKEAKIAKDAQAKEKTTGVSSSKVSKSSGSSSGRLDQDYTTMGFVDDSKAVAAKIGSGCPTPNFPKPTGTIKVSKTIEIHGTFDGKNQLFLSSGLGDGGQSENQLPLFQLQDGATIQNVLLGNPSADGIHCLGSCTIRNAYNFDVGEDFITFGGNGTNIRGVIEGGGALHANDKVIMFNSGGVITISGFYVNDYRKLVRSCGMGQCREDVSRHIVLNNVVAVNGYDALVAINQNHQDTAEISNVQIFGRHLAICSDYDSTSHSVDHVADYGAGCRTTGIRYSDATCSSQ